MKKRFKRHLIFYKKNVILPEERGVIYNNNIHYIPLFSLVYKGRLIPPLPKGRPQTPHKKTLTISKVTGNSGNHLRLRGSEAKIGGNRSGNQVVTGLKPPRQKGYSPLTAPQPQVYIPP
jgi:hypothetical protein